MRGGSNGMAYIDQACTDLARIGVGGQCLALIDLGLKFTLYSVGEFTHSVALRELS